MIVVLIATIAIVLGTLLGVPIIAAIVVGLALGFFRPRHAARHAAIAGALAWGGVLAVGALRGDALGPFATTLGGAMGIPGWAIVLATLLYPALLASSAAWLAHVAASGRLASIYPGAIPGGGHPNT
jgi:hypothetical protein